MFPCLDLIMIEIDGLNGGGQILRTVCSLSAVTRIPVKVFNIRGARPSAGLKVQHLNAIKAVGQLCDAEIKGLSLGSKEIEFHPKKLVSRNLNVNLSTAASIGLVLQALLIATPWLKKNVKFTINGGGTWNKWAPPVMYLENVLFPLLGEKSEIKIIREGYYPRGGAKVEVLAKPLKLKKFDLLECGGVKEVCGISIASKHLKKARVAERQAKAAEQTLEKFKPKITVKYVDALNPGSGILVWAKTTNSILGGDSLGERGKKAEKVGREAANNLLKELDGAVDSHAADMILPYLAIVGGKIRTTRISNHIRTNAAVIEKFFPNVKFNIDEKTKVVEVITSAKS